MPPAALMSVAAWSTPFFICAPVAALAPVIGPPTPNLTWADADPAKPSARPSARASAVMRFIGRSPQLEPDVRIAAMLCHGGLRRQRSGPFGALIQRYCLTICAARALRKPIHPNAAQIAVSTR